MERINMIYGKNGLELPHDNGNWILKRDFGYSPVQLLASSIGACGAYVYASILKKAQIPYWFYETNVEYEVDTDFPNDVRPLKSVDIEFRVKVEEKYQEKAKKLIRLVSNYCPVIQSLDKKIKVREVVVFTEE